MPDYSYMTQENLDQNQSTKPTEYNESLEVLQIKKTSGKGILYFIAGLLTLLLVGLLIFYFVKNEDAARLLPEKLSELISKLRAYVPDFPDRPSLPGIPGLPTPTPESSESENFNITPMPSVVPTEMPPAGGPESTMSIPDNPFAELIKAARIESGSVVSIGQVPALEKIDICLTWYTENNGIKYFYSNDTFGVVGYVEEVNVAERKVKIVNGDTFDLSRITTFGMNQYPYGNRKKGVKVSLPYSLDELLKVVHSGDLLMIEKEGDIFKRVVVECAAKTF